MKHPLPNKFLLFILLLLIVTSPASSQKIAGIFEQHSDAGSPTQQGSCFYDSLKREYEISSGLGKTTGGSHFVYKRIKGDFILYARISFPKDAPLQSRMGWMIRSNTDSAAYIDAAVDRNGLTSMRRNTGNTAAKISSKINNADVIQLERNSNTYTMRVARFGEPFSTEQVIDSSLGDEVCIGLFATSTQKNVVAKGVFHDVNITVPVDESLALIRTDVGSNLEILDIETGSREVIYSDSNSIRSPIWTKDGKSIIYGKQGLLYNFDLATRTPQLLYSGEVKNNTYDHALSPNGKTLAFCIRLPEYSGTIIHTIPVTGGTPTQINKTGQSFPHSWSPDGKDILFGGSRKGEYDVFKIPANGGKEVQITDVRGYDDSPEYMPDGKHIYFISNRTGTMLIWRMNPDGTNPQPMTPGDFHDWFPHISPDGKWVVFLSYSKDEVSPVGHPSYKHVYLRLMPVSGGKPKVIAYVYGGQGTINSPCWSPDSKKIAFASNNDITQ